MSFLVRKIQIHNWMDDNNKVLPAPKVRADGITSDLKSAENAMSFWEIDSLDELGEVALSIFTGRDDLSDFFIVAIPKNSLKRKIEIENNQGATAYGKYKTKHYDLVSMDLCRIKYLVKIMAKAIKKEKNVFSFSYQENKDNLKILIASGKIVASELKKKVYKDLNIA